MAGTSEKNRNKSKGAKDILFDYSQETSLPGVKYTTRKEISIVRRIAWIVYWLFCAAGLLFLIIPRFQKYHRKPVATRISVDYNSSIEFPAVTICNLNRFRYSSFSDKIMRDAMGAVYGFEVDIKVNWSDPYFNTLPYKTNDAQLAWIRTASHQIEKMMRKCFWKNREVNCSEYFTSTLTDMGFCYTLNSREGAVRHGGRPLLAGLTGSQNGLRVQLNAEQYEYTYSESNAAGFKVLVHDMNVRARMLDMGLVISPGTDAYVAVRQQKLDRLPPPYEGSVCVDSEDSETFRNHLAYSSVYSLPECEVECLANFTIDKCKCKMYYMPGDAIICTPYQMKFCFYKDILEEYARRTQDECHCVEECRMTSYSARYSAALYPSEHILFDLEKQGYKKEYISKNMLELRVYYEELNFDSVVQSPGYDAGAMFGDVGGLCGLCLGVSIISFYEVLEMLSVLLAHVTRKVTTVHAPEKTMTSNHLALT